MSGSSGCSRNYYNNNDKAVCKIKRDLKSPHIIQKLCKISASTKIPMTTLQNVSTYQNHFLRSISIQRQSNLENNLQKVRMGQT